MDGTESMSRRRRTGGDEGISLVETVVAMLLFSVFAVVVGQYLLSTLRVGESNTQRITAANLAAEQSELVRSQLTLDVPDGTVVLPTRPVIAGTRYTLTRDVRFVAGPSGGSVCADSSDALAYKLVTITVDWDGRGTVQPVRTDTLKTVGLGANGADVAKGTAAVAVQDGTGALSQGRTVTVQPGGLRGTTGADGCVVFPNLLVGVTYTASVDEAPYVGQQGSQLLSSPFSVSAGAVTRTTMTYARRGALEVTLVPPTGQTPPAGLGVTVNSSVLAPSPTRVLPDCATASATAQCVTASGLLRTAGSLFPAQYTAWPGTCGDAKPASPPAATVTSGGTARTNGPLAALKVTLGPTAAARVGTQTLYAFHRPVAGSCPAGEIWAMTVVSGTVRQLALPAGSWDLALSPDGSDAGSLTPASLLVAGQTKTLALA